MERKYQATYVVTERMGCIVGTLMATLGGYDPVDEETERTFTAPNERDAERIAKSYRGEIALEYEEPVDVQLFSVDPI